MAKLTKEDIAAFANQYLKEDNYAVIYKKQGKDPNEKKMTKPEITPIVSNRDVTSPFLTSIQEISYLRHITSNMKQKNLTKLKKKTTPT